MHDFPEKGMYTVYMGSVDDQSKVATVDGKVRATCHIMLLVVEPAGKDKKGRERVRAMLASNIDINGLVPKWIVNLASKSAPGQWFKDA